MQVSMKGFVTVVFFLTRAAGAQQLATSTIDSGTLVRAHLAGAGSVRGRLLKRFAPGSSVLTFCHYPGTPCVGLADPSVQTLPSTQVTQLDVAHGNNWLTGGVVGGLAGGIVGILGIAFAHGICDDSDCTASADRSALGALAVGIGLGLAFGFASAEWRPAP